MLLKRKNILKIFSSLLLTVILISLGCSDRIESPVVLKDSTIVHPPKLTNGISACISFSTTVDRETDELIGTGTLFKIMDDAKVYAKVTLENLDRQFSKPLLFHIDWIDQKNNSFFRKQIILSSKDASVISSSISISPGKRDPGKYALRIYLYRELIAEKHFILSTTEDKIIDAALDTIKADITLSRKIKKKTETPIGVDSVFVIGKKSRVYAIIKLVHLEMRGNRNLTFYLDWVGPDNNSFYNKEINYSPDDTYEEITSSISIPLSKREPGRYKLRFYLFDKLKSEKQFELIEPLKKSK